MTSLNVKIICDDITIIDDVSECDNIIDRINELIKRFSGEKVRVSLTFSSDEKFYELIIMRNDFNKH